jgi:hypothetical protein
LVWWAGSAAVLIILALLIGFSVTRQWLGLLIDLRGRYSLTHLQLSLWTIVISSLLAGVFFGRWQHKAEPFGFTIPSAVLWLVGISVSSAAGVTAAKIVKNTTRPANIAAAAPGRWQPSLTQIYLLEEGAYADQTVDIAKFQNFVVTIVLVLAYIGLAVRSLTAAGSVASVTTLPGFSGTFLILLAVSHAGYLAGKLPSPEGQPSGLTVASREVVSWAAARSAASEGQAKLRPGLLWRYGANVNVWSDEIPTGEVPAFGSLAITDSRPFILHWTVDNWVHAHDATAVAVGDRQYAVMLGPADFSGAADVQFTRRYLDRSTGAVTSDGWEGTPATDHVVRLL